MATVIKEACPMCGKKNAVQKDCGYSTFNPVWVECLCGFRIDGGVETWDETLTALRLTKAPAKKKRRISDALARMYSEEELMNMLLGKTSDGKSKFAGHWA